MYRLPVRNRICVTLRTEVQVLGVAVVHDLHHPVGHRLPRAHKIRDHVADGDLLRLRRQHENQRPGVERRLHRPRQHRIHAAAQQPHDHQRQRNHGGQHRRDGGDGGGDFFNRLHAALPAARCSADWPSAPAAPSSSPPTPRARPSAPRAPAPFPPFARACSSGTAGWR